MEITKGGGRGEGVQWERRREMKRKGAAAAGKVKEGQRCPKLHELGRLTGMLQEGNNVIVRVNLANWRTNHPNHKHAFQIENTYLRRRQSTWVLWVHWNQMKNPQDVKMSLGNIHCWT